MEKAEDEDLMNHFHAEALAAVMNQGVRTALLKGRYLNVANSNKDISSLIQQHRDEFMHQISQRSLNTKREMKSLFQHG
ncbi:hypothetical protein HMI56_002095 [Coelomomyces lativittatus]|nr:hypothetical protein HMI56_002095 [Coelomomyces lativittatus]